MEPVTFTIANELAAISVLQAAAAVYVKTAVNDDNVARQTELVIEEIVTNIIQYEYLPGQRGTIALTLSVRQDVLELLIRFQGIPFDVDYLKNCEKTGLPEMIEGGGRGIGLHLLGRFNDEVRYCNMGWEGQEICIRRLVHGTGGKAPQREDAPAEEESPATPPRIGIRRMRPGEAAAISKLAYFAYQYTYVKEEIYHPEEIRQRNEDGRMLSYVAVNEEDGSIMGHMAMIPDALSGMPEFAAAFVNPRFRRYGCMNILTDHMIRDAREQGWQGAFGTAVTSHTYSQSAAGRMGMRESALFVSRVLPLAFQAIADRAVCRESFLYMVRLFDSSVRLPYHPPARHREMIEKISRNAGMTAVTADNPGEAPFTGQGETETRTDAYEAGHIVVHRWGADSLPRTREVLRRWCLDRMETIYLYLPLCQPSTASLCPAVEEMGFFFSGLMPGRAGKDWLVLQYLNNQRYDYGRVRSATAFGRELVDYVRGCDPTA